MEQSENLGPQEKRNQLDVEKAINKQKTRKAQGWTRTTHLQLIQKKKWPLPGLGILT